MAEAEEGLLTQEEQLTLRRVGRSRVWKLTQDALFKAREDLFAGVSSIHGLSSQPSTNEALWMNRGAILLIQHLLREGPLFVVWYQRQMKDEADKKALEQAQVKAPEREFSNVPAETPDFDL